MATVSTTIHLMDRMTAPIMSIQHALSGLESQFAELEKSADVDASSLTAMRNQIDMADASMRVLNDNMGLAQEMIEGNTNAQRGFNNHLNQSGSLADNLSNKISKIAGMLGIAFGARAVVNFFKDSISLTNQQITAEQQLANVLANQGANEADFLAIKQRAAAIQSKSMYGDESMIGGAAELSTYLKDASAVEHMMGTLSNYAAGMSGGMEVSYQQMVDYATQLGKALDGTYDGLKKKGFELSDAQKQIIENGTDMEKALVIDDVINQSWANLAEQMAQTPQGIVQSFNNAWGDVRESIGAQILPVVMNLINVIESRMPQIEAMLNAFIPVINAVVDAFSWVIDIVFQIGESFSGLGSTFGALLDSIQSTVSSVMGSVVPFIQQVVSMIVNVFARVEPAIQRIMTAATPVITMVIDIVSGLIEKFSWVIDIVTWLANVVSYAFELIAGIISALEPVIYAIVAAFVAWKIITLIMTAAQWLLNVAMLANPITWIIVAVVAIIAAIAIWANAVGGFRVLWLIVVNAILTAWDWVKIGFFTGVYWVLDLWDKMKLGMQAAGVAIANFMGDMKASVLMILQNMVNGAINIINGFIGILNKIPGVNIGLIEQVSFGTEAQLANEAEKQARNAGLDDARAQVDAAIAERAGKLDSMKDDARAATADRLAAIDAARAEAQNKEDSKVNTPSDYVYTDFGGGGGLGGIADDTANIAGNTKSMAEFSEENLKYLRDIAERETVNRYTTVEIDMGGFTTNNTVNSEMDLDGIVSYISDGLEETLLSIPEGVFA